MAMALDDYIYCSPFASVLSLDRLSERRGDDDNPFEVPDPAPDIPDMLDQKRAYKALNKAVNGLPERQQAVICTIFFQERSVAQTARNLSISPAAVVKLREKGLKRLRTELSPHYSELLG